MARRLKDFLKRRLFALYEFGSRLGIHVLPVHYYSPIPDVISLAKTKEIWARDSTLPGVDWHPHQQATALAEICGPFQAEYAGNSAYRHAMREGFGPGYGYIEAQALHGVVRHFQPSRIVEVGSGASTWCMLSALAKNREARGRDGSVVCIEPHPSSRLRKLSEVQILDQPVQTVPFDPTFAQLGENDLLFIDSSHTVKPGGDVNYLILEILPRLKRGVVVHVHDIYLPYDYQSTVLKTFFHWAETSLLRAFFIHNDRVEILFCLSQLHFARNEVLPKIFPEYTPQADQDGIRDARYRPFENPPGEHLPTSIYFRIR